MSDILDDIEDILGEEFEEDESQEIETRTVDYQMTRQEAEEITEAIKSSTKATFVLLAQAHQNKAHKALNYSTWAEYVKTEFEISPQHSYNLLDLERVIRSIEEVTPEGTVVKLTEAQARDIKRELPRITEQIAAATEGHDPAEARALVDEIIAAEREQIKLEEEAAKKKQKEIDEAAEEGYRAGLEAAADALLEQDAAFTADAPDTMTGSADGDFIEYEVDGKTAAQSLSPQEATYIYNLLTVLRTIGTLPEPDEVIDILQEEHYDEVEKQILEATSWINRFQSIWETRDY